MDLRLDLFLTQRNSDMEKISVVFPEETKKYIELQSNDRLEEYSYLPEIEGIEKYLKDMNPRVALDVGSGIGRASVFFFKYFDWKDTMFILADGDSGEEQLSGIRTGKADFYNSLEATESYCQVNGMQNFKTFNLEKLRWDKLSHEPNLVYSFKAVGFHWAFNPFLEESYSALGEKCRLIFDLRAGNPGSLNWTREQIGKIDPNKYKVIALSLEADRKKGNFMVLEKK